MSQAIKVCCMCEQELKITDFNASKATPDGLQAGCRDCHIEYKEEYEKSQKSIKAQRISSVKWNKSNKTKVDARLIARKAIKSGDLTKQLCEICSSVKTEAHHEDYSNPLDVTWLCRKHHRERHQEINEYLENNPQMVLI